MLGFPVSWGLFKCCTFAPHKSRIATHWCMVFVWSILIFLGYLVQSRTLTSSSTDTPSAYTPNFIVYLSTAQYSHEGQEGVG